MTNESKVYFGFRPSSDRAGRGGAWSSRAGAGELPHDDAHGALVAERVADDRLEETAEVALDPVAREVVGDEEDERVGVQRARARLGEPGRVRRVVQSVAKPGRDVDPEGVRTHL